MSDTPNPESRNIPNSDVYWWLEEAKPLVDKAHHILANLEGDTDDMAELLVAVDLVRYRITELYKQLVILVTDRMGDLPELSTANGFVIEKRTGSPRKQWDHKSLGQHVARRIIQNSINMDTGEVLKDTESMLVEMLEYAAPSYWRVKNLAEIGIVADDYCELGEAKASVIIRNND